MNPLKCAFGIKVGNFLGFLVHEKGIKIDANKAKTITQAQLPTNKKNYKNFLRMLSF